MIDKEIQDRITKYDLLFESRLSKAEATQIQIEKSLDQSYKAITETIRDMKSDMKWGFGFMIGLFGVVFGLMAKGFHWY